jgi:hypothetical protein
VDRLVTCWDSEGDIFLSLLSHCVAFSSLTLQTPPQELGPVLVIASCSVRQVGRPARETIYGMMKLVISVYA